MQTEKRTTKVSSLRQTSFSQSCLETFHELNLRNNAIITNKILLRTCGQAKRKCLEYMRKIIVFVFSNTCFRCLLSFFSQDSMAFLRPINFSITLRSASEILTLTVPRVIESRNKQTLSVVLKSGNIEEATCS